MKTGTDVQKSGLYVCECCVQEKLLHHDQLFPRCPKCLALTRWTSAQAAKKPLKKSA